MTFSAVALLRVKIMIILIQVKDIFQFEVQD